MSILGATEPLFRTSGNVSSGFQGIDIIFKKHWSFHVLTITFLHLYLCHYWHNANINTGVNVDIDA